MASYPGQFPQNIQEMPTQPISSEDGIHTTTPQPSISSEDGIHTATQQPSDCSISHRELRKELFKAAMSRDWKKLLGLYKSNKQVHKEKITRAKDTVLHVAMSGAPEYTVLRLLDIVDDKNNTTEEKESILGSENQSGDTPLHLAASLGLKTVCRKMAEMCPGFVITARNNLQETALFTAVRHGKKKTFFVLEAAIHKKQGLKSYEDCLWRDITHCRRYDGNNILHIAIKREHFGLAYEIIHLYPELVNYVNSRGESALHDLARKASVFKSGTRFGLFDTIIYNSTITDPLKLKFNFNENKENNSPLQILKDKDEELPSTCKACVDLYYLIKDLLNATFNTVASSLKTGICKASYVDEENQSETQKEEESKEQRRQVPPNYDVAFSFFNFIFKLLLIVLGIGSRRMQKIQNLKQTHKDALKIMKKLVDQSTLWEYGDTSGGMKPSTSQLLLALQSQYPPTTLSESQCPPTTLSDQENTDSEGKNASPSKDHVPVSPVLVAAKSGITEMVKRILEKFPVALLDEDKDEKNIALLAAEHRQVHVYKFMLGLPTMKEHVFEKVDKDGNSVLHLSAAAIQPPTDTGVALQLQREIKWYKYVENSVYKITQGSTYNNKGMTAAEVFTKTYESQFKESDKWLNSAASSFSVVATLIVTVAYMASSTVPGGFNNDSGFPIFQNNPDFQLFTLASLIALCFSIAALVTFLCIIIIPYQIWDFEKNIPLKLIFGSTCSIISIGAMLVSFCAGHSFTVDGPLRTSAFVLYGVLCIPVFVSIKWLSNMYTSLFVTTFSKVPSFRK